MGKEYDPYMHTAEHVLNRTMVRMFDCGRSYSAHLNADKSKCDYHFPRPLTPVEALDIERVVNEELERDLPVTIREVPRSEAETLVNLEKLPDSVAPDQPIRLVFIGDYDVCACIGEHVSHTGEIGMFRLMSHEFTPASEEGEQGRLRIRFRLKRPAVA